MPCAESLSALFGINPDEEQAICRYYSIDSPAVRKRVRTIKGEMRE
eukprot:gene4037-4384_t